MQLSGERFSFHKVAPLSPGSPLSPSPRPHSEDLARRYVIPVAFSPAVFLFSDMTTSAQTTPYWSETPFPRFAKLDADTEADVVVVGAGITGLTAAYALATAGRSVLVIERGRCASVDTGHTSAHLTMVTDTRLSELVNRFGASHAQAVWDAGLAAIAQIDEIVRQHEIDCGFDWVEGYLHLPTGEASPRRRRRLKRDAELAAELGFDATFVDEVPLVGTPGDPVRRPGAGASPPVPGGPRQGDRGRGRPDPRAHRAPRSSPDPLSVTANGHRVTCGDIVIATHNPLVGVGGMTGATLFQTKLALYSSYVVAGRVREGRRAGCAAGGTPPTPIATLRVEPHRDHDVVILGGEDHKTGQAGDTEARYARLEQALARWRPASS